MRDAFLGLICLAPTLGACAPLPGFREAPEAPAAQADWPALMPMETILDAVPPAPTGDPAAPVTARAAALRARAAALLAAGSSG